VPRISKSCSGISRPRCSPSARSSSAAPARSLESRRYRRGDTQSRTRRLNQRRAIDAIEIELAERESCVGIRGPVWPAQTQSMWEWG
jgi:hypothetical protein